MTHSVETPNMVDPQRNILYWKSKWISTQSAEMWLAVSGGQPLFTLELTMFALSQVDFLSLLWASSTDIYFINFCQKYPLKDTKSSKKNPCRFKTWMGFVGQILIKLGTSFICGFLWLPFDVLLAFVVWGSGNSLQLSALWKDSWYEFVFTYRQHTKYRCPCENAMIFHRL